MYHWNLGVSKYKYTCFKILYLQVSYLYTDSLITAIDTLVAAEFGDFIIISVNCKCLFKPLINPSTVKLRSDYHFGTDDPMLYWLRTTLY